MFNILNNEGYILLIKGKLTILSTRTFKIINEFPFLNKR